MTATEIDSETPVERPKKASMRTCAGCRETATREALVRLSFDPNRVRLIPDLKHRLGGRGVSVHPSRACVRRAAERGGFQRALRTKIEVDAGALAELIASQYLQRVQSLILAAHRQRRAVIGTDAALGALREAEPSAIGVVVIARDAARRDELRRASEGARRVELLNKDGLGRLFGRSELGVVTILDEGIGREVASAAAHAIELAEAE